MKISNINTLSYNYNFLKEKTVTKSFDTFISSNVPLQKDTVSFSNPIVKLPTFGGFLSIKNSVSESILKNQIKLIGKQRGIDFDDYSIVRLSKSDDFNIKDFKNSLDIILPVVKEDDVKFDGYDITNIYVQEYFNPEKFVSDYNTILPAIKDSGMDFMGNAFIPFYEIENFDAQKFADDLRIIAPILEKSSIGVDSKEISMLATSENFDANKFQTVLEAAEKSMFPFDIDDIITFYSAKNFNEEQFVSDLGKIEKAVQKSEIHFQSNEIVDIYKTPKFNVEKFASDLEVISKAIEDSEIKFYGKDIVALYNNKDFDTPQFVRILNSLKKLQMSFSGYSLSHFYNREKVSPNQFEKVVNSISSICEKAELNGAKFEQYDFYSYLLYKSRPQNDVTLKDVLISKMFFEEIQYNCLEKPNPLAPLTEEESDFVNSTLNEINENIEYTIKPTEVSIENIQKMFKGFFANNNDEIENTIINTNFTQYGKKGIPLKYQRKEFIKDLNQILSTVDEDKKTDILNKLGIKLTLNENGYDGIIDLSKLSKTGVEGEVLSLANKFIRENSVETDNPKLNEALNSLISGMPEFVNIIGKQQHPTHNLSLDTHIFSVYKEALSNPNYKNLTDLDKTCLKLAIILHDVSKEEGVIDSTHPKISAMLARDVLQKYNLPNEMKNKIQELIKNHHWLKAYNTNKQSEDYIATLFRRPNDFEIAKIMAESDLKGVSENFYDCYSGVLKNLKPIEQAQQKHNEHGQIILTSRVIQPSKLPLVEYNAKKYKVVDFTKLDEKFDLGEYGFEKGLTPKDLRLLVHMKNPYHEDLDSVRILSNPTYDGILCTSFISLDKKSTYRTYKFGFSLQAENPNIVNATSQNMGSGCEKGFEKFVQIQTSNEYRMKIPKIIQKQLNISEKEYGILYDKLANKNYYSQIKDNDVISVGRKKIKGSKIKKAIKIANDEILSATDHNEANLYTPKINAIVAKVNDMSQVPEYYLSFAQKNNLPIYLLGKK